MHAIGRAQTVGVVVVGAAADRMLALLGNGVRPGEPLLVVAPQLIEGRQDLLAVPRLALPRRRPPVRVRIVLVLHPLPDVAGKVVVPERPPPRRVTPHVFGPAAPEIGR